MRRKGLQRGSLFCRKGVWHVAFRRFMPDAAGNVTYRQTSESTHQTTKRAARAAAAEIVARANAPADCPRGTATLSAFVDTFFWPQHVAKLKRSGQIHYRTQWLNHVKPSLGDMQMNDVTAVLVQRLITTKHMAGMGASGLRHVRNVIAKIFGFARAMGYFKGDLPAAGVTMPRAREVARKDLTPDQVERILEAMGGEENAHLYRALVILLANTGLRVGEALGLDWRHVDLGRGMLQVERAWTKGEMTTTKSGKIRVVPMVHRVVAALGGLRELAMPAEGLVFRAPGSASGRPVDHHNFATRIFKPACRAAGVPWASIHCLRHTMATQADDAGLTMAERMQVLGHSAASVTMSYTHATAEAVRVKLEKVQ